MYVYCANNGVVGVSAKDGAILWETTGLEDQHRDGALAADSGAGAGYF